jgi:hypothetical protein
MSGRKPRGRSRGWLKRLGGLRLWPSEPARASGLARFSPLGRVERVGQARVSENCLEALLMLEDRRFWIWGSLILVLWSLVYDSGFGRLLPFI